MRTVKPGCEDYSRPRVYLADEVREFDDATAAYWHYLGLPSGVRAAYRAAGDCEPVQPWHRVDRPEWDDADAILRKLREGEPVDWEDTPYVACDEPCFALREPRTEEELRAALVHWRDHSFTYGCSHGK